MKARGIESRKAREGSPYRTHQIRHGVLQSYRYSTRIIFLTQNDIFRFTPIFSVLVAHETNYFRRAVT